MWCKILFSGEAIENQECNAQEGTRKGPQNLLELLPDAFTREEAGHLRQRMGIRRGQCADDAGQLAEAWVYRSEGRTPSR